MSPPADLGALARAVVAQVRRDGYFSPPAVARELPCCWRTVADRLPALRRHLPDDVRRLLGVRHPKCRRVSDDALAARIAGAVRAGVKPSARHLCRALGVSRSLLARRLPFVVGCLPPDVAPSVRGRLKRPWFPPSRRRGRPAPLSDVEVMMAVGAVRASGRRVTVAAVALELGAPWETAARRLARLRGRLPADVVLPPSVRRVSE
jgi:hypothetical protein